jgi:hypothetical protein
MIALFTLCVILFSSIVIVKIASKILVLTGLSEEVSKFQAKSAFTGTGFTTTESESVIAHPLRRKVLSFLMTISNIGIISVISTSILTFINIESATEGVGRIVLAICFMVVIVLVSRSKEFDSWLNQKIKKYLASHSHIELADYANLLHLGDKYGIGEIAIQDDHWFFEKTIEDLSLTNEGLLILGVQSYGGEFLGLPSKDYQFDRGDVAILYGRADMLQKMGDRSKDHGEKERKEALDKIADIIREENEREQDIVESRE